MALTLNLRGMQSSQVEWVFKTLSFSSRYEGKDYSSDLSRVTDRVYETHAKSPETLGWFLGCFWILFF